MPSVVPRIVNNVSYVTRISHDSHFGWQAQYSVMLKCHFSWQAQCSVKFGMIARARNVAFFNGKCAWRARNVTSVARRVADGRFHGRILLGSFSHPARIGRALQMTFQLLSRNFCESFKSQFAWQAQYSVMLEAICCSAHCK